MKAINTKYGVVKGVVNDEYYKNGALKECMLDEYNQLNTKYGLFVPRYGEPSLRSKYTRSLSFYPSGEIKSIQLEHQTEIITSIGVVPAELITFYANGAIHRIFPLNGRLSGYWTEEEEYELANKLSIALPYHTIEAKVVSIQLYESQAVKSITLWRQENVELTTLYGNIITNIGFSFYESGELKSIEPKKPCLITTPIGQIKAHDVNGLGIHADKNSLELNKDQSIKSLITSMNQIEVIDSNQEKHLFAPRLVKSYVNESQYEIETVRVSFLTDEVVMTQKKKNETFPIKKSKFDIKKAQFLIPKEKDS